MGTLRVPICVFCEAEREGFEPPVPLGTVVFKTTVIDHSTISPVLVCPKAGAKVLKFYEPNKFLGNFLHIQVKIRTFAP